MSATLLSVLQENLKDSWWLRMKHAMITNPCGDLLHIFFSAYLAPDHAKWDRIQALSDQLAVNPRDWELWLRRAVLYLQCGVGLYADSDAKEGLKLKKHGLLPRERESSFYVIIMLAGLAVHVLEVKSPASSWFQALTSLYPLSHRIDVVSELNFIFSTTIFNNDPKLADSGYFEIDNTNWKYYPSTRRLSNCVELLNRAFYSELLSPVSKAFAFALFTCMDDFTHDMIAVSKASSSCLSQGQFYIPLYNTRRKPNDVARLIKEYRGDLMQSVDIIQCIEKGGLMMIATRDIDEHEILFNEPPICGFRATELNVGHVCAYCWIPLMSEKVMYRCPSCSDLYCSENCHQMAQNDGHNYLCSNEWTTFRQSASSDPSRKLDNEMIETIGVALTLHAMALQRGFTTAMDLPELKMLRSRQDTNDPKQHLKLMKCNYNIGRLYIELDAYRKKYPKLLEGISYTEMYDIRNVTLCNIVGTSGRMDNLTNSLHATLYLLMSYMNNDCDNYVAGYTTIYEIVECNSRQLECIHTKRSIKQGEEITCRYNGRENDYDRKLILRDTFRFICKCNKCKDIKIDRMDDAI